MSLKTYFCYLKSQHVSTQTRKAREDVSTQDTLAHENVSTQDTLTRTHVRTQSTLAREHVSMQDMLARKYAKHTSTWAHNAYYQQTLLKHLYPSEETYHAIVKREIVAENMIYWCSISFLLSLL